MRRLRAAAPYLIVGLALLAQSGKAFHIDDATFLALARDAIRDPLHPYGPGQQSNPPGNAWLLGLFISLFGGSERALHLALLPISLLAVFSVERLARVLGVREPALAALFCACSGCFLLPASLLMPEPAMIACVCGGAALLFDDAERPRAWKLALASLLFACGWTLRISALPVLLLTAAVQLARRNLRALVPLSALITAFALWSWSSRAATGAAQTVSTAELHGYGGAPMLWRLLSTCAALFLFSPAPLFAAVRERKPLPLLGLACLGLATFLPFAAAFVALGAVLFMLGSLRRPALDLESAFLWLWFAGALAVPVLYNQAAAKFVLLALPPLFILALRDASRPALASACAAVSLSLALVTAVADERYANALRDLTFAQVAAARAEAPHAYVAGTAWGAEEYAPRAGGAFLWGALAVAQPGQRARIAPGDELLDLSHPGSLDLPREAAGLVASGAIDDALPVRTMTEGAGLWSSQVGLLPFVFARGPIQPWWRVRALEPLR